MIKQFKITPVRYADSGDPTKTLTLDLYNPELSGFAVQNVTGLGPVKAKVNMSDYATIPGAKCTGTRQSTRSISFKLVFFDTTVDVEELRHRSYLYFPIGEMIDIEIETDFRKVRVNGLVESNQPSIWGRDLEGCDITVLCESPYLESPDVVVYEIAEVASAFHFPFTSKESPKELLFGHPYIGDNIIIHNTGDVDSGCIFEIIALKDISNPMIKNISDDTFFELLINMDAGDVVTINTNIGKKSVSLKRGSKTMNIINYIKEGSTWFVIKRGDTVFEILYTSTISKTYNSNNKKDGDEYDVNIKIDRNGYTIPSVKVGNEIKQAESPHLFNPVDLGVPTSLGFSGTKKHWHDEYTDPEKYDYTDETFSFTKQLSDSALSDFGIGYIDVLAKKLIVTHVKRQITIPTWIIPDDKEKWNMFGPSVFANVGRPGVIYKSQTSTVTKGDIKPNTTIYSNRFKYNPNMNGVASLTEASYYIKDFFSDATSTEDFDVCFWDNTGKVVAYHFSRNYSSNNKENYCLLEPKWYDDNPVYFLCELKTPYELDLSSSMSDFNELTNNHAVVNSIEFNKENNEVILVSCDRYINYIYDYYPFDSGASSSIDIPDGYAATFLYFVCVADFNENGYTSFSVNVANSKNGRAFTIDWSGIENLPTFYGGIVDFTSGKLINQYDEHGDPIEDQVIDISSVATAVGAPNDQTGYTITVEDGVIYRLIYPIAQTNVKNRMNLKIERTNYYLGI